MQLVCPVCHQDIHDDDSNCILCGEICHDDCMNDDGVCYNCLEDKQGNDEIGDLFEDEV